MSNRHNVRIIIVEYMLGLIDLIILSIVTQFLNFKNLFLMMSEIENIIYYICIIKIFIVYI